MPSSASRIVWLACERRAEVLLGLLAIAGVQRADARIRIRDFRRLILEVRRPAFWKNGSASFQRVWRQRNTAYAFASCRVIGLELRGLFVVRLGVVASAELIVRDRDHAMRVGELRILLDRTLQNLDRGLRLALLDVARGRDSRLRPRPPAGVGLCSGDVDVDTQAWNRTNPPISTTLVTFMDCWLPPP